MRSGLENLAIIGFMNVPRLTQDSIADIPEDELVGRLLSDQHWRSGLIELEGIPRGALDRQKVPLDTAPGHFSGDVDVLLCAQGRPEQAVAFEWKRIKFGKSALRTGMPNKLREYNKAVQQANRLAAVGFWKVYLYIVVVIDAREQNSGKISYEGLSSRLKSLVRSVVTPKGLDQHVGLCELEFTQPMDYAPLTIGAHGGYLQRQALAVPQSEELTKWVAGVFSQN